MPNQLAANSVRTYHLAPEGFSAASSELLGQRAGLLIGVVAFLLVLQYKEFGDNWHSGSIVSFLPSLFLILFLLGAMVPGVRNGLKRNRQSWDSYELVIGEDFLIRRIADFPELEVQRHEVTVIKESPKGLRVQTKLRDRSIGIASALVGYDDAKERLSSWGVPWQNSGRGWVASGRWIWALPMLVLVLFGGFYLATSSWLIVATGLPLFAGISWSLWFIRKSVQVSAYAKRMSLVVILPLWAIAVKLVLSIIHWH